MSEYNEQRAAFDKAVKTFEGNNSFAAARALLLSGEKTVSFNRKIIEKNIDSSWLTEIEKALPHLDTVRLSRVTPHPELLVKSARSQLNNLFCIHLIHIQFLEEIQISILEAYLADTGRVHKTSGTAHRSYSGY